MGYPLYNDLIVHNKGEKSDEKTDLDFEVIEMEFNKRELRTIIQALKLQLSTYLARENQDDIDESDLAEVIMDRGYTESLLSAIENEYNQRKTHLFQKELNEYGALKMG
jgi:hypothetical protein